MSYQVEAKGKKFIVSNRNTGRVVAAHKTKAEAITQAKALRDSENGEMGRMEVKIMDLDMEDN